MLLLHAEYEKVAERFKIQTVFSASVTKKFRPIFNKNKKLNIWAYFCSTNGRTQSLGEYQIQENAQRCWEE